MLALIGLLTIVGALVSFQVSAPCKTLAAVRARVGLLTGVDTLMGFQGTAL